MNQLNGMWFESPHNQPAIINTSLVSIMSKLQAHVYACEWGCPGARHGARNTKELDPCGKHCSILVFYRVSALCLTVLSASLWVLKELRYIPRHESEARGNACSPFCPVHSLCIYSDAIVILGGIQLPNYRPSSSQVARLYTSAPLRKILRMDICDLLLYPACEKNSTPPKPLKLEEAPINMDDEWWDDESSPDSVANGELSGARFVSLFPVGRNLDSR